MDLSKLSRGDQVIAVSGIVLFIFSFFDWLGAEVPGTGFGGAGNAWDFTLCWFAVIIGIAMVAVVGLKAAGVDIPSKFGNFTLAQVLLGAGGVAFVFVLIKLITGPSFDTGGLDVDIDKTREIGIFVGLIATAGLAAGGYLKWQEEKAGGTPSA